MITAGRLTGPSRPGTMRFQGGNRGVNMAPAPAAQPQPQPLHAAAAPGATTQPGSPMDFTFWSNVYQNAFNNATRTSNLQSSLKQSQAANDVARQHLQYLEPRSLLADMEAANRRGAFYSSPEEQSQADIKENYAYRLDALARAIANQKENVGRTIGQMGDAQQIYNQQQYWNAVQRANQANLRNTAYGITTPVASSVPSPSQHAVQQLAAGRGRRGRGGRRR